MNGIDLGPYKKAFVPQLEQSDCGVACLAGLVKYYGGEAKLDRLRELSGTGTQGTTMLGLCECARETGFEADAYQADIPALKENKKPCILHVIIDERQHHYVICYGFTGDRFIISDPAKGVALFTAEELSAIWKSKALLLLSPGSGFVLSADEKKEKTSWLRKLIETDLNILGVALFLGIAIAVLGLATAVFSQKLIDDILPNSKQVKLTVGLSLLFFLLTVRSLLLYIRQYFLLQQSRDFNNRIITLFYNSLLRLPKSFFDTRKTGELIARMNDTGRIQSTLSYLAANLMIDVLLVVVSSVFLLGYSWQLGLVGLLSVPAFFAITWMWNGKIVEAQKDVMRSYARNEGNYVDTIQGVSVIKSSNKEELYSQLTRNIYDSFQEKVYTLGKVRIGFNLAGDLISTVLMCAILSWGSVMVLDEGMKLGAFMAVVQMTGMLMPAAVRLALTNVQLQEAKVAFERMYEFASIRPEYEEARDKEQLKEFHSLEAVNISFRFPGRQLLLRNISFEVKKGEMIAILGESGSGKSTLLQVLERFYKHAEGAIQVNGIHSNNTDTRSWRAITASVPQQVKIFNGTLIDNICLGEGAKHAEEVVSFCMQHGFHKYFMQLPQNYLTIIGEEGVSLSGGQQQLVAIARALYRKPQLLLMDEPTSAMDRNTEGFIMNILMQAKNEMGIVLVTHRTKTAKLADRIYILENGVIHASGRHEELLLEENLYSLSWRE
jgi:ABC-type bacteriocin/lantibiotic exporter with double-glycine peptidase domain